MVQTFSQWKQGGATQGKSTPNLKVPSFSDFQATRPPKEPSLFSKAVSLPGKAIQGAGNLLAKTYGKNIEAGLVMQDETGAEKVLKTAASLVGGAGPENLPLGIGPIVQEFKNAKDPNYAETNYNITVEDFLTGIKDTSKAFLKTPVTAVSNLSGTPLKFNVPVLGEVTNRQFNAAERIRNGEDPILVTAEEGLGSVWDSLFLVGMVSEIVYPRNVTVAKGKLPKDSPVTVKAPLKSFSLYKEPILRQPVTPVTQDAMTGIIQKYGLNKGATYNPELPTYFQMTGKSGTNIKVEVVQIRPSYLSEFSKLFNKPKAGIVPTTPPMLTPKQFAVIPPKAITPIITREVNVNEIKNTLATKNDVSIAENGNMAIQEQPPEVIPFSEALIAPQPTETSFQPTQLQKGQTIQATSPTGVKVIGPIIEVKPDGLIIQEPTSGLPMLYKSDKFTFEPTKQVIPETIEVPGVGRVEAIPPKITPAPKSEKISNNRVFSGDLKIVADNIIEKKATKEEFLKQLKQELTNQNLSKREAIQNLIKAMEKEKLTPSGFYDAVTNTKTPVKETVSNEATIISNPVNKKLPYQVEYNAYGSIVHRNFSSEQKAKEWIEQKGLTLKSAETSKTQKEKVASVLKNEPKTIKQIAEETKIKEPNIRRILGVGAKEGTFERVDKGVYILSKDGQDLAWIEAGNSLEVLPRLISEGKKFDMIYSDLPYESGGNIGGNRPLGYVAFTPEIYAKQVVPNFVKLSRTKDTAIIHIMSTGKSAAKAAKQYNDAIINNPNLKLIAVGSYTKLRRSGEVSNMGKYPMPPEAIMIFNQSGNMPENLPTNFEVRALDPRYINGKENYKTQKAVELVDRLIEMTTSKGDNILDPFAGSGLMTAQAVKKGRLSTAIEIDKNVVENIIKPRVKNAIKQADISNEIVKPKKTLSKKTDSYLDGWNATALNTIWVKDTNSAENGYINIYALDDNGENNGTFRISVETKLDDTGKMIKNPDGTDRLFNSLKEAIDYANQIEIKNEVANEQSIEDYVDNKNTKFRLVDSGKEIKNSSELKIGDEVKIVSKNPLDKTVRVGIVKKLRPPKMAKMIDKTDNQVKDGMTPDGIIATLDKPYMFGAISTFENNIITRHTLTNAERVAVEETAAEQKDRQDHMMMRGKYAEKKEVKFRTKKDDATDSKDLLVVHNLNETKLRFADRIGGLANPSMAIFDPNTTAFDNYGDISLIGDKYLIEGQKTHLADAYSPRFPSVHTTMKWDDFRRLERDMQPYYEKIGEDSRRIQHDDSEMVRNIENNPAVVLKFLEEKGITPSKEGQHYYHSQIREAGLEAEYQTFLDSLYKEYNLEEKLFAGYTNNGNRRYKTVSVEEASRIMSKQKEEGFNYGLGSFRSKIAPIKRSADAIKKEAGRLISPQEFETIKESYNNELFDIKDILDVYAKNKDSNSFIENDNQLNTIGSVLSGEKDAWKYFNYKFPDAPEEIKNLVIQFREKLKDMPTEYFETKFNKPVGLHQFQMALVPESTSPEVISILEKNGLEIVKFKKGERQQALQKLQNTRVAFRLKDDLSKVGIEITDAQEAEIFALNEKIFGDQNVKIMGQILANEQALGSYQSGIIRILDGQANPKDTYLHEAVHKYLDVFTDRQEYIEILREAQARYGIKDLGEVEEKLAEDFIKYARDKENSTLWQKLKDWFDKILSRIKKYLGNSKTIEEFYNDIISGKAARQAKESQAPPKKSVSTEIVKPKETPKQKIINKIDTITYNKLDAIAKTMQNPTLTRNALEKLDVEINIAQELIDAMPGKTMIKFISRKEGQFEDFKNPDKASTPLQAQKIQERNAKVMRAAESAFEGTKYAGGHDDVDVIRESIDEYTTLRDKLKATKEMRTEKRNELSAVRKGEYLMQLTKGDRRSAYKSLQDTFMLTDTELAKIRGGRDIMSMTREEFDDFMFRAESEAQLIQELSSAKMQLQATIFERELKKWENVAEAMKLPKINEMSLDEIKQLDDVLSQYKQGDEFLTTRQLETIDRTELTGLRTVREVLNHLAKKTGVTPEMIKVQNPDVLRFLYDTQLQRHDPFSKLLVDKYNVSFIKATEKSINVVNENDELIKKARKSRPATILQKLVPADRKIKEWLEAEPGAREELAKDMTPAELKAAEFQNKYFSEIYDWMSKKELEDNFTSRFEDKYYPHIRRGFLEAWKDEGFIKALGEAKNQFKQDEAVFTILNEKTGEILPYQKWVKFEQFRSGGLIPSQNAALSFKTYVNAIEKAKQFDEFIPEMMIYAHTLSPRLTTARGVEMDDRIQKFLKKWVNSKKGRVEKLVVTPGSAPDWALRTSVALIRVLDLGLNFATQVASFVGEQSGNVIMLRTKYPLGVARLLTKQGKAISQKYENFIGKSIFDRFAEPSADVGDKLMTGLMGIFASTSRKANQTFLLSMMTPEEFNSGTISPERLAEFRNEMGRYRVVEGAESIVGKSAEASVLKQHKKWAIPMIVTTVSNFRVMAKNVKRDGGKGFASKEGKEFFTATLLMAVIGLGALGYYESLKKKGKKRNFIEDLQFKMIRESMSLIQAIDPRFIVGFTQSRLESFLLDLSDALTSIVKLEEYKTTSKEDGYKKGDLKGVQALERIVTPAVIKQITK